MIIFPLTKFRQGNGLALFGPPLPPVQLILSGTTRDSSGTPLGGCTVSLFRFIDNLLIDSTVSDGSGNYSFTTTGLGEAYFVRAVDPTGLLVGTTVNTLAGV